MLISFPNTSYVHVLFSYIHRRSSELRSGLTPETRRQRSPAESRELALLGRNPARSPTSRRKLCRRRAELIVPPPILDLYLTTSPSREKPHEESQEHSSIHGGKSIPLRMSMYPGQRASTVYENHVEHRSQLADAKGPSSVLYRTTPNDSQNKCYRALCHSQGQAATHARSDESRQAIRGIYLKIADPRFSVMISSRHVRDARNPGEFAFGRVPNKLAS